MKRLIIVIFLCISCTPVSKIRTSYYAGYQDGLNYDGSKTVTKASKDGCDSIVRVLGGRK